MLVFAVVSSATSTWYLDLFAVSAKDDFRALAGIICEEYLPRVRGEDEGGNEVDDHLWDFVPIEPNVTGRGRRGATRLRWKVVSNQDLCTDPLEMDEEEGTQVVGPDIRVSALCWCEGSMIKFVYDYGTTTEVMLRATALGDLEGRYSDYPRRYQIDAPAPGSSTPSAVQHKVLHGPLTAHALELNEKGFDFSARFVPAASRAAALSQLPASSLPPSKQLDALFPSIASVIMSKGRQYFTLGLMNKLRSEHDEAPWAAIINGYAPLFEAKRFACLDEFLCVANHAYDPKVHSAQSLSMYRSGWVHRQVHPCTSLDPESNDEYQELERFAATDKWGPRMLLHRLSPEEKAAALAKLQKKKFSFAAMFPRTHAQLTSGLFRWIRYQDGLLRVCAGRATADNEAKSPECVLKEWPGASFTSLHQLMCAVELSWVGSDGLPLGNAALPCDADAGALFPTPPVPRKLLGPEEAVLVHDGTSHGVSAAVSCIVLHGAHLFTGHADGLVCKWSVDTLSLQGSLAAVRVPHGYKLPDVGDCCRTFSKAVDGLLVSPDGAFVYVWGAFPTMCVLDSSGAGLVYHRRDALLDVGYGYYERRNKGVDDDDDDEEDEEEEEEDFRPWANVAVLGPILSGTFQSPSVLFVGMNAIAARPSLKEDHHRDDVGEGNILLVDVSRGRWDKLGTWNGHACAVTALALVGTDLLLSCDSCYLGPMEIHLWKLATAYDIGQVLRSFRVHPSCSRRHFTHHRINSIHSIHVEGSKVTLLCNHGNELCVLDVEKGAHKLLGFVPIELSGWGGFGHEEKWQCGMAASGSMLLPWNRTSPLLHCFDAVAVMGAAPADMDPRVREPESGKPHDSRGYDRPFFGREDDDDDDDDGGGSDNGSDYVELYKDVRAKESENDEEEGGGEEDEDELYEEMRNGVKVANARAVAAFTVVLPELTIPSRHDERKPGPLIIDDFDDRSAGTATDVAMNDKGIAAGYHDGSVRYAAFPPGSDVARFRASALQGPWRVGAMRDTPIGEPMLLDGHNG